MFFFADYFAHAGSWGVNCRFRRSWIRPGAPAQAQFFANYPAKNRERWFFFDLL